MTDLLDRMSALLKPLSDARVEAYQTPAPNLYRAVRDAEYAFNVYTQNTDRLAAHEGRLRMLVEWAEALTVRGPLGIVSILEQRTDPWGTLVYDLVIDAPVVLGREITFPWRPSGAPTITRSFTTDDMIAMAQSCKSPTLHLVDLDLRGVDFAEVERVVPGAFVGAALEVCDLRDVDLTGVNLTAVRFVRCTMSRAYAEAGVFERAVFAECSLRGATFTDANLGYAEVANCDVRRASFVGASMPGISFRASMLDDIQLQRASVVHGRIIECSASRMDARDVDLTRMITRGSQLLGTDFRGATLTYAVFVGSDLDDVDIADARISGGGLRATNCSMNMDLRELPGADAGPDVLIVTGMPSGHVSMAPTLDGWLLQVGCWSGDPDALRELIETDDWPEATEHERDERRPGLALIAALAEVHAKARADVGGYVSGLLWEHLEDVLTRAYRAATSWPSTDTRAPELGDVYW